HVIGAAAVAFWRAVTAAKPLAIGRVGTEIANLLHETVALEVRVEYGRGAELRGQLAVRLDGFHIDDGRGAHDARALYGAKADRSSAHHDDARAKRDWHERGDRSESPGVLTPASYQ